MIEFRANEFLIQKNPLQEERFPLLFTASEGWLSGRKHRS